MSAGALTSCGQKARYPTKAEAKRRNPSMRPYRCPFCDGYHVRSNVKRGGRKW